MRLQVRADDQIVVAKITGSEMIYSAKEKCITSGAVRYDIVGMSSDTGLPIIEPEPDKKDVKRLNKFFPALKIAQAFEDNFFEVVKDYTGAENKIRDRYKNPPTPPKLEAAVPEIVPVNEVAALDAKERIFTALKGISDSYLEISRALYEAKKNQYFVAWGYDSMRQFILGNTDLEERAAESFAYIGEFITENQFADEDLEGIGWAKLQLIARGSKNEKVIKIIPDLIDKAATTTVSALQNLITNAKGTPAKPEKAPLMRMTLGFKDAQAKMVSDAMLVASNELGGDATHEDKVAHIMAEWLHLKGQGSEIGTLESYMQYISDRFEVECEMVNGTVTFAPSEEEPNLNDDLGDEIELGEEADETELETEGDIG